VQSGLVGWLGWVDNGGVADRSSGRVGRGCRMSGVGGAGGSSKVCRCIISFGILSQH
jgi:hypothetical protein